MPEPLGFIMKYYLYLAFLNNVTKCFYKRGLGVLGHMVVPNNIIIESVINVSIPKGFLIKVFERDLKVATDLVSLT